MGKRLLNLLALILSMVLIIGMFPILPNINAATGEYGTFVDGYHVIDDMIAKWGTNTHPRIIMTEERFAELRSHINDGSETAELLNDLRNQADWYLDDPQLEYRVVEKSMLVTCQNAQYRITTYALAYNIFGDETYAEHAYSEMVNICNFRDWNPQHFLDPSEVCTGLAFGYDWLYNWMNDNQRAFIRNTLIEKGLNVVMLDYKDANNLDYHFPSGSRTYYWARETVGENWQFVCTGGTNLAALAIGDEAGARDIAAQVIDFGFKKAYVSTRLAYSMLDGSYVEGLGYWDYATFYLGYQSSALMSATGTDYGLADYEGLRKSIDFVRGMSSNTSYSFSFGDDKANRNTGWFVFLWLGQYYNSPSLINLRIRNRKNDDMGFRYQDLLWFQEVPETGSDPFLANPDWVGVQYSNATLRSSWDPSGLSASLHLGLNDYRHHGHYDLGSFYVDSNGTRFFSDLGNEPDYNLFQRQYSYRIQAEGHNTLVINPSDGLQQQEAANCVVTECRTGNEAYAISDLTNAYEANGANSVVRGLQMIKDKDCVIIQDEISLNEAGEIYWFAHVETSRNNIAVAPDGRSAIITKESERLWVGIISEGGSFTVMDASPLPSSRQVAGIESTAAYQKLAIHLTNTRNATIMVACIPLRDGQTSPSWIPTTVLPLSEWSSGSYVNPTVTPTVTNIPTLTDTPVPTESDPVVAFAERLYTCALNRDCDIGGRDYWVDVLRSGASAADAAHEFLFSSEIEDEGISDSEFIARLYMTFMGREGADIEINYWLELLSAGESKETIFQGFVNSPEWANLCYLAYINSGSNVAPTVERPARQAVIDFATRLYTTCLDREGDEGGIEYWSNLLANMKISGSAVARDFFFSDELINSGILDEEFIARLYKTFMGRDGADIEVNYWLTTIEEGRTREDVFNGFAVSTEFSELCRTAGIIP